MTVGAAFDGRGNAELAEVLGPLARALPLSSDIEEGGSFRHLLTRLGRAWREAERWQAAYSDTDAFHAGFSFGEDLNPITAGGLLISLAARQAPLAGCDVELSCTRGFSTTPASSPPRRWSAWPPSTARWSSGP
jgi:hypothetical protein